MLSSFTTSVEDDLMITKYSNVQITPHLLAYISFKFHFLGSLHLNGFNNQGDCFTQDKMAPLNS